MKNRLPALKKRLLRLALKFALKLNLWTISLQILIFGSSFLDNKNDVTFLVVTKTGLLDDLYCIKAVGGANFPNLLIIDRLDMAIVARHFSGLKNHNREIPLPLFNDKYLKFAIFSGKILMKDMNVIGIYDSNWNYSVTNSWHRAFRQIGINSIVMLKEGWMSDYQGQMRVSKLREFGQFPGNLLLTINAEERERHIVAGVIAPEAAKTVGMPRFDNMHKQRSNFETLVRKKIVFFVPDVHFPPNNSIEYENEYAYCKFLEKLILEVFIDFSKLAKHFPDLIFEVKTKVTSKSIQAIKNIENNVLPHGTPDNLTIVTGGVANAHLREAVLCVSFNSTSVLDAIASGVPVAVPRAYKYGYHFLGLKQDYAESTLVYRDRQDLSEIIQKEIRNSGFKKSPHLSSSQKWILNKAVGNSDGFASHRAWEQIAPLLAIWD